MMTWNQVRLALAFLFLPGIAAAQMGFGVDGNGVLFRFNTDVPSVVFEIGHVGFIPEGIDFRPSTDTLYAIDITDTTAQLYVINIYTGAAVPVGNGFPSVGVDYDLSGGQTFGFDFNPKTLNVDGSMRIRLVSSGGSNLRLNSSTGAIAVVDAAINPGGHTIDAVAYINNLPQTSGTTVLYDMDYTDDELFIQSPPNNGTVASVGSFGVTLDALDDISFDIFTPLGDSDTTIGGDFGFAVLRRPDAPIDDPGIYLLYDVNLGTGGISNGATVGSPSSPYDFIGGFALLPIAFLPPQPAPAAGMSGLLGLSLLLAAIAIRRLMARPIA